MKHPVIRPRSNRWLGQRPRLAQYPQAIFWSCFLLLNLLLFLPLYLLHWQEASFWPWSNRAAADGQTLWRQLMISRENFDPFRIHIELFLLTVLWVNVGWLRRPRLRHLFSTLYLLTLCYYIYEAITLALYQSTPVFYHHYYMALDGLGFLATHLNATNGFYGLLLLVAAVLFWLVYQLATLFYQCLLKVQWGRSLRLGFGAAGLLLLGALMAKQGLSAAPTTVLSSVSYKLQQNLAQSRLLYQEVQRFDDSAAHAAYAYGDYTLPRRPNIYLLFIESYGSVLYKRPDYRIDYSLLLKELKRQLDGAGWYSASALSDAPAWGGGSWLAYTSAEFGLQIDNHPYYLTLLDRYQQRQYPHLGNFLRDQGYHTYRLSSLTVDLEQAAWERYARFYNVDGWLRVSDLAYTGPLYGWGPALPDQYALHAAHEQLARANGTEQPWMLFFITQNSHYPYAPLPPLVDDWQTLNRVAEEQAAVDDEAREHDQRRQDYFAAIAYDLRMLVQFILQIEDENALFLLMGDHQPPRVSRRADGFDTPVHLLTRDPTLLQVVQEHGFTPGLWVNEKVPTMQHAGLYSLLVRALLAEGEERAGLPPYLPNGVILEQPTADGATP